MLFLDTELYFFENLTSDLWYFYKNQTALGSISYKSITNGGIQYMSGEPIGGWRKDIF